MFGHSMGTVSNNYVAGDFSVLHVSSIKRIPYINPLSTKDEFSRRKTACRL